MSMVKSGEIYHQGQAQVSCRYIWEHHRKWQHGHRDVGSSRWCWIHPVPVSAVKGRRNYGLWCWLCRCFMIILWLFERAIYLSQISEPLHEGYQPVQKTNKQTKKIIQEKAQREKSCCLSNRGAPQQFWCCCANCCRMLKSTTKKKWKEKG